MLITDTTKILSEANVCGLEAYLLLNKHIDPAGDDLAFSLQTHIMAVCKLQIKTIHEELAAIREAQSIIREMERRTGNTEEAFRNEPGLQLAHSAQLETYAGMLFVNFLSRRTVT